MKRLHHTMANILKDFAPGPLDYYRKKASFDWKKLKVFLDSEDIVEFENELYEELRQHPDYETNPVESLSFDEERRKASRQSFIYKALPILSLNHHLEDTRRPAAASLIMMQLAPSSSIKHSVGTNLFQNVIHSMGSERHYDFIADSEEGKIFGCFCLTEIGHGTNTKGMRTTATYDKKNKQFIIHTPDFEAAKCWAGSLGHTATHAVVFAQLVIDGVQYGLHSFVVPIRDPKTLRPLPGVTVGDMGEKIGLNGIDNGFIMFDQIRIPRRNLLNRTGDVTDDGKYVTPYKDPSKRHGASLGALSGGRVAITNICAAYGTKALTIAIRYAAVRKQFGPDGGEEVPILEYQSHQHRLLPYLAATYVLRIFSQFLLEQQYKFSVEQILKLNVETLPDRGLELHGVSSACKPVAGWTMRDAIQECREACGGHGYLKAAGLGDIRNDNDANCTYEGENHVLVQQTSNWLLKYWPVILKSEQIYTPLGSADFLSNALRILKDSKFYARSVQELCTPSAIMDAYQWLTCFLLQRVNEKLEKFGRSGVDPFWAKNDSQVYYAKNLSIVFIQHFFLKKMLDKISEATDPSIKTVLTRLFSLYGLWSLEKHIPYLYQGGYMHGAEPVTLIQDAVLQLCKDLKDDAVALVDVIAVPDFVLNSVLGASDGRVYQRLQSAFFEYPGVMSRPTWWREIINHQEYAQPVNSKL